MKQLLQETQIFGPVYSFMHYPVYENIIIEGCENYQKKTFRNRYQLLTTNGLITLSIPLKKGKNNQTPISEILISYDEPWHLQHLHTIRSAYGNSAYFEYYYPEIEQIFMEKESHLLALNQRILDLMIKNLKLSNTISISSIYLRPEEVNIDDNLDFRNCYAPQEYHFHPYPQVWSDRYDFIKNLSILDLLFCMGHESIYILNKSKTLNNNLINALN